MKLQQNADFWMKKQRLPCIKNNEKILKSICFIYADFTNQVLKHSFANSSIARFINILRKGSEIIRLLKI